MVNIATLHIRTIIEKITDPQFRHDVAENAPQSLHGMKAEFVFLQDLYRRLADLEDAQKQS